MQINTLVPNFTSSKLEPWPSNTGPSDVHVIVKGTTHRDHVAIDCDIAFKNKVNNNNLFYTF